MKLIYYLKVGFKTSIIEAIAGLIVLIPAYMFVFPFFGFDMIFNTSTTVSNFMNIVYLLTFPIILLVQGFALYKYRNWIFK